METELSLVDGERGILVLRGKSLEELAPRASVEAVAALLWSGVLPARAHSPVTEGEVEHSLADARRAAFTLLPQLGAALSLPDSMDALRAAMAQLPATPPGAGDAVAEGARLAGATAVFA